MKPVLFILLLGLLCACSADDTQPAPTNTTDDPPITTSSIKALNPAAHLTRASITLRGIRPSLDDLHQVSQDPDSLPQIIDRYLEEPAFGRVVRNMHNEVWQLRSYAHLHPMVDELAGEDFIPSNQSIAESPLRLIEHVVTNDLPYTEIVTADYTLADGIVAKVWGLEYQGDGTSWEKTRWDSPTDAPGPWQDPGRPHSGILSDSYLFVRHDTTPSNLNRGRANTISRALLCFDFLDREIIFDSNIDLSDPIAAQNALRNNPSCASCHQALDPLGQFFWIYDVRTNLGQVTQYPRDDFYHPERVELLRELLPDLKPGYFGHPEPEGTYWSIRDLGQQIAQDPRFASCATKRFTSYLTQTEMGALPIEVLTPLQDIFQKEMNAKDLVRAIVLSEMFRSSHVTDDQLQDTPLGMYKVRPLEMSSMIEDLTGFRWEQDVDLEFGAGNRYGLTNMLEDPVLGFLVMAGGIDAYQVTVPQHTFTVTSFLTQRLIAYEAAGHVVRKDFEDQASQPHLLTLVTAEDTDEDLIRQQLVQLHLRLYGEETSSESESITQTWQLWDAALQHGQSAPRAWAITLAAMLQDPRFIFY